MDQLATTLRVLAYWLVVLAVWWICVFVYVTNTKPGWNAFIPDDESPVWSDYAFNITAYYGAHYLGLTGPLILAGSLAYLLLTGDASLPLHRWSWLLRPLQRLRGGYLLQSGDASLPIHRWSWLLHPLQRLRAGRLRAGQSNQFGMGDTNMALVFVLYNLIPVLVLIYTWTYLWIETPSTLEEVIRNVSINVGFGAALAMAFFLIPVARHNVILAAVGFSPVHALRLHTWSGWLAFWCVEFHGLSYILYMLMTPSQGSLYDRSFPKKFCWTVKEFTSDDYNNGTLVVNATLAEEYYDPCGIPWWNITGYAAGMAFLALVVTSLNGFRRRYYRLFYLCHITLGPLTFIFSIIHWDGMVNYLMPSLVYYLVSTVPSFVQALASRFRGGVRVTKVVEVTDSGGCLEVHVGTMTETSYLLDKEACMVVKLLVPSVSMVWHPFTVYKVPSDPLSTRFLMRPVGPFTKALAAKLILSPKPIMMLDGYYRGGDRINEALAHDVATIVCGGVAITPFLSMIPMVIQARGRPGAPTVLKKLVVHFAVREEGLATFIEDNYINVFKSMMVEHHADQSDFTLQVLVYHTCQTKTLDGSAEEILSDEANVDLHKHVPNSATLNNSVNKPGTDSDASGEQDAVDARSDQQQRKCHNMEHARFMPAIYSSVKDNLVHFLTIGVSLWIGLVIYNHWLDTFTLKVYESNAVNYLFRPASTYVWIALSFGLAVVFEFIFLHGAKYLPRIKPETYVVTQYDPELAKSAQSDNPTKEIGVEKLVDNIVVVDHRVGRPASSDVFDGLASASCPGLFLCGPPGLTGMVKRHAGTQNSYFGLTRYAMYEEPFEM